MNASDYQKEAARTLIANPGEFTNDEIMLIWGAMGLAGEAGEVSELIKKGIFHRHGLDTDKLRKELGDVLWYIASICTVQGFDMGEIMAANIEKLATRYPNGFTTSDSVKRVDVHEWTCKCDVKFQGTGFCDVCLMGYKEAVLASDFDICECGHSRKHHRQNSDGDTACYHKNDQGLYDDCTEFTLAATIAHDDFDDMPMRLSHAAPVEMCECGHDEKTHIFGGRCSHFSEFHGGVSICLCQKYSPIPALLPNQNKNP